jgi:hypothetical protein
MTSKSKVISNSYEWMGWLWIWSSIWISRHSFCSFYFQTVSIRIAWNRSVIKNMSTDPKRENTETDSPSTTAVGGVYKYFNFEHMSALCVCLRSEKNGVKFMAFNWISVIPFSPFLVLASLAQCLLSICERLNESCRAGKFYELWKILFP